jgi:hypothetical protein
MLLRMQDGIKIENPRDYGFHDVEDLRYLLTQGREAHRDPHRESFYQVEGNRCSYFIYISPITGNVVLLARWLDQRQNCYADSGSLVA